MWRYLWLCPVYITIAALPLIFPFGQNLEYEYALAVGILAALFIPASALLTPAEMIPYRESYAPFIKLDIPWIFVISPVFMLLPGAFVFGVGACQCSGHGYLFWLAVQAYPAWVIGHGFYHLILRARCAGWRKLTLTGIYGLATISAVLGVAGLIWFTPQVRITDTFLGFLHGPIYDNFIPLDAGVVLARCSHLLFGCAALAWAFYKPSWEFRVPAGLLTAGWLGTMIYAAQFDSVAMGQDKLNELLPGKLTSEHFTIHYTPGKAGKPSERMTTLFQETTFHVHELRDLFGNDAPFVDIYVYPSQEKKKLWFGGGSTDVADVQSPSIHITAGSSPHGTLRHELVHALASGIGFHGLGFHPNMAFTEGLAVALAPEPDQISLHDGAAALITSKRIKSLNALFSPMFWKESGSRAYTVAGSIIKYLLDKHGIEPVKRLYAGEDWEDVFGESKRKILINWRDFIFKDFDKARYELYAEALYRNPGVLRAKCPHTKADYRHSRTDDVFVRLRQPTAWDPGEDYWTWRLELDPQDKTARLRLWSKEISKLASQRLYPEGRLRVWQESLNKARRWPPKSLEDVDMAILQSDIVSLLGDKTLSTALLRSLLEFSETKGFGEGNMRRIQARLAVEQMLGPGDSTVWRKYLAGWLTDIPNSSSSDPWILSYLRLRRGTKQVKDPFLLRDWLNMPLPKGFANTFYVEWYRFIGLHAMDITAYNLAEDAFEKAAAVAPSASREYFKLNARRAKYMGQKSS